VGAEWERGCTASCSKLLFPALDSQTGVSERVDRPKAAERASFAEVTALMFCMRARLTISRAVEAQQGLGFSPCAFFRAGFVVTKTPVHCSGLSPDRHFEQDAPY